MIFRDLESRWIKLKLDKNTNILIVGLGIIGGSFAKGFAKAGIPVNAIDTDPHAIEYALENSIIEKGSCEVSEELISQADLIIFALYPHIFKEWIKANQKLMKPKTIISDVTGVKECIIDDIQYILREDCEFIAAHPMAGCEKLGIENSNEKIFHDANYIIIPTELNTHEAIDAARQIGETLGFARISSLSPHDHDEMIGFVSQLTHCIAMTLMTCNDSKDLQYYTGDSFRDLTRIARIDETLWSELFLLNKDSLLHQMKLFTMEFSKLERMLMEADKEGIKDMMRRSTARRKLFDKE